MEKTNWPGFVDDVRAVARAPLLKDKFLIFRPPKPRTSGAPPRPPPPNAGVSEFAAKLLGAIGHKKQ